ncbi:hypothetical protein J6590_074864 [Homalodisca vitripennis]|nr:hypothetical protein J6590_074864 [Homalodisca vitripennis]
MVIHNNYANGNRIKQCRAWLLLGWVTAERSCPRKQSACPAIGSGSEVTFKPLVPKLRQGFLALTSPESASAARMRFATMKTPALCGKGNVYLITRIAVTLAALGSLKEHVSLSSTPRDTEWSSGLAAENGTAGEWSEFIFATEGPWTRGEGYVSLEPSTETIPRRAAELAVCLSDGKVYVNSEEKAPRTAQLEVDLSTPRHGRELNHCGDKTRINL